MFAARYRKPDTGRWVSESPAHTESGHAARGFASVDRSVQSTDGLLIQPVKLDFVLGKLMPRGILIPRVADPRYPLAERQLQLAVDQITHIHGTVGNMVFHVVELVQVSP